MTASDAPLRLASPPGAPRLTRGLIVLIAVGAAGVSGIIWALAGSEITRNSAGAGETVLLICALLLVAAIVLPLSGRTVRTLARHTLTACLRTKVAAVFVVLLAAALGTLPLIMQGDGTLTGKVQTFLAWGTGITALLLSLVTIFLATGVVASDVRHRQIFSLTTKPMGRWEYILGRWLGVSALNVILVALAGVAIYGVAQYQRGGMALNPDDHRRLETEVFTARVKVSPVPVDIDARVRARLDELVKDPRRYEDALAQFMKENVAARGDRQKAHELLVKSLQQQALSPLQSAPPGGKLRWEFDGIHLAGKESHGSGTIKLVAKGMPLYRIQADDSLLRQLIHRGPVEVNGVLARVVRLSVDSFDAAFSVEAARKEEVRSLRAGDQVELTVDPVIQITYKASADGDVPGNTLKGIWRLTNPRTGATYVETRTDVPGQANTVTPPARVVDKDGKTVVEYFNLLNPRRGGSKITILQNEISVLYRVDSFTWNFLRGMALILLQLMFLAALGVLAASFASFPVACILCFVLLPFSIVQKFLSDAVRLPASGDLSTIGFVDIARHYLVLIMSAVLPNFRDTSPGDRLVDGTLIAWTDLGSTAVGTLAVRATLALLIACVIFRYREMARVQV